MKTIHCKECQRLHQLFYFVTSKGKRELSYNCEQVEKFERGVMSHGFGRVEIDFVEGLGIPERWSRGWTKQQQGKQQKQLEIMK